MKIAVLADIHGNLPALEAVIADIEQWQPERVVVAGDVINRGPRPLECLLLIVTKMTQDGWLVVQGNHEEYVTNQANPQLRQSAGAQDISRNAFWTFRQLNRDVSLFENWPTAVELPGPDGQPLRFVHASMISNRDGIYPDSTLAELRQLIAPAPAVLCAGHTHRPVIHKLDSNLVINVGSVGMPFDGDRRATYLRLTWENRRWQPHIKRLRYDWRQTERDFHTTGFLPQAGDLGQIMLVEFQQAKPLLNIWTRRYYDDVIAGKITVSETVRRFMAEVIAVHRTPAKPVKLSPVILAASAD